MTEALQQDLTENDRRLRRTLVAFFNRRVQNLAEAEDLTQDVFVRISRSRKIEARIPDAYIFRIASNLLVDRVRSERVRASYREARSVEDYLGIDPLDPHRIAESREDLTLVARAITELPEKTRRIFTLYRLEHMDKNAIAQKIGLSVRMVEIHIRRALVALSLRMESGQ